MFKLINSRQISFFLNGLIAFIIVMGTATVISKSYELFIQTEEINILKADIPWNRPIEPVTVMFDKYQLEKDPVLIQQLNLKLFIYDLIERIIFLALIILILIQLKKLLIAIRGNTFFELQNILLVKKIALLVGIWVLCNFAMYQLLFLFLPFNLIVESINLVPLNESFLQNLIVAVDFKMLFVFLVLYVISVFFKEGYALKKQSDLTI